MPDRPLTEIRGVGPATAHELARHGFDTVGKLASARPGALTMVPGFGPARAAAVWTAARELLGVVTTIEGGPAAPPAEASPLEGTREDGAGEDEKRPSKAKKTKKGKSKKQKKGGKAKKTNKGGKTKKGGKDKKQKGSKKGKDGKKGKGSKKKGK